MARNRVTAFGVALLVAALVVAPAGAGGEKGSWELGPYGGYAFLDDYDGGAVPLSPDDDALVGGRVGWFVSPTWSVEISYQQLSSETGLPAPATNVDFDVDSIRLNGLYNFRPGRAFRPFLTFGAGVENTEAEGMLDADDEGLNAGGGLRWFLAEHFGVRLDARYVSTKVRDGLDKNQGNVETTAGLLFSFGGAPPKDTDGDGVRDGRDKCPDTPRGATVDEHGCPKDADGDGVCDGVDRCPGTPAGRKVDEKGCEILFEKDRASLVLEGVHFEFDSDKLTAESSHTLDSVAASLREWSDVKVEVQGHTDSKGNDAYNQKLSQRRAEAVRAYLVGQGVDGSRIEAQGFGESKPVGNNATDEGRAQNRRVELKRL